MPKRNPYRCQLYGYKSHLPCGKPAIMSAIQNPFVAYKIRPILLCEKCWIAVNRGTGAYLPYDREEGKH